MSEKFDEISLEKAKNLMLNKFHKFLPLEALEDAFSRAKMLIREPKFIECIKGEEIYKEQPFKVKNELKQMDLFCFNEHEICVIDYKTTDKNIEENKKQVKEYKDALKITKPNEVKRDWIVVDAAGKRFGRLLTEVATILRGKNKPCFTPNVDCGDYVIIINASKVEFTGNNKAEDKLYHRHSGYFGSVKSEKFGDLIANKPEKLFKLAVRGMLPKTKLGREMIKKLKVYAGSEHPHTAQIAKKEGK